MKIYRIECSVCGWCEQCTSDPIATFNAMGYRATEDGDIICPECMYERLETDGEYTPQTAPLDQQAADFQV